MLDKLARYRQAEASLPAVNLGWPLYGAGLDTLGQQGAAVAWPMPECGANELLARHDAVGLCFSDLKEIQMGPQHPRLLGRDMRSDPVIAGHEACLTVLAAGANLRDRYRPGQRFAVQPDMWLRGQSIPYGYQLPGAFQQYNILGDPVLAGDAGCYLIPIPPEMTYAAAALSEPWACVEAAYRMTYRTELKPGGTSCFVGCPGSRSGYRLDAIWKSSDPPARVVCSGVPQDLAESLGRLARKSGAVIIERAADEVFAQARAYDDIVMLDCEARIVNRASEALANDGVLAILANTRSNWPIHLDLGRLHYDEIYYCGWQGLNLDDAYRRTPARSEPVPQGVTWIVGAGGPMGRMHLQRCMEGPNPPRKVVATDVSAERLAHLRASFGDLADERGVTLYALSPISDAEALARTLADIDRAGGVDDALVMAPAPEIIATVLTWRGAQS
jgi:threonine dehydrogenase-like Zn-dependent dehydrogenase